MFFSSTILHFRCAGNNIDVLEIIEQLRYFVHSLDCC